MSRAREQKQRVSGPLSPTVAFEISRNDESVVYLGVIEGPGGLQKPCVVRRLRAHGSKHRLLRSQLQAAGALGARLRHPNVVETYASGDIGGVPFLCTEWVSGDSARAILRAARELGVDVPVGAALRIVIDALHGLHHLHTARDFDGSKVSLVHRLVSAENVLVGFDGRALIGDLRGAVAMGHAADARVEVIVGKQGYMAPEHRAGGHVSSRVDIYACGILLWELCTGERSPFGRESAEGDRGTLAPVSSRVLSVGPGLDAIVERATHADPASRFESALAFAKELEGYATEAGIDISPSVVEEMMVGFFADQRERIALRLRSVMEPVLLQAPVLAAIPEDEPSGPISGVTWTPPGGHRDDGDRSSGDHGGIWGSGWGAVD